MKITVIGAGSTYTPELVEGFARRSDVLPLDELALFDVDAERLRPVAGLAGRILQRAGFGGRLSIGRTVEEAVDGSSAVLVQLRVGGQSARLLDETLPGRYKILGQETTGAGGFAKALRTVPVVRSIAETARRHALDDAWIIDFTNPVGIVTRALLEDGHRALGLCNVAIGFQRRLADMFGVDPADVFVDHAGLNHLTWIRAVEVRGEDRTDELFESPMVDAIAHVVGMPAALIRALRAIPSYYLKYFYATDEEVERQAAGSHRALEVMEIEKQLLEMYADPALTEKPSLLEKRGGAFYSEAAAALATSLLTGDGAVHYVNVLNNGAVADLPDDAVVEVPARVDRTGATPLPVAPFPPAQLGLLQAVTQYEVLTLAAARTGDREAALKALLAHPLVRQWHLAVALLDDILRENRPLVPAFHGGGAP